jgi:hypothetical protein
MPTTYPAPPPSLSSDVLTINRFLNSPADVQRRVRELTELRFLADSLLAGRYEAAGGAVLYEIGEPSFTDRAVEAVTPGAEYPRSTAAQGTAAIASVTKWGQDVPITDEAIGRQRGQTVERVLRKVANTIVRQVDTVAMTAIVAAVTQTQAAVAAWNNASADPFLDVMLAKAQVDALDTGYDVDTLVMPDIAYARMIANSKVLAGLARESSNTVTSSGEVTMIAGVTLLRSARLGAGVGPILLDRTQLGGLAYEQIPSPEYEGDPANGVQTWIRRDPDGNDQWLVRGRRPVVPIVQEPACAVKITGA